MRPLNNIVFSMDVEPYRRYAKTCSFSVSGKRLNPHNPTEALDFILAEQPDNAEFDYDKHVIEIYTDREDRYFKRYNAYLFEQGFLAPYAEGPKATDLTNVLSDEEINEIAAIRLPASLNVRLREYTSLVTVNRIYDAAVVIGRPMSVLKVIEKYRNELKGE